MDSIATTIIINMMTYEQCVSELYKTPLFGRKTSLDDLSRFLESINNPHKSLQFIHVAGTNGKGSICAMLASIYKTAGYKVGLFTSPHLIHVNERIRINNVNISNQDLVDTYEMLQELLANQTMACPINPTFFETVFIMALHYFMINQVDIVILETGIGGLKDCTNIVASPLASIITMIDYDHVEILGNDLESIARQKAGIIKNNRPVIYMEQSQVVNDLIELEAQKKDTNAIAISEKSYKIDTKAIKNIDFSVKYKYYDYKGLKMKTSADYHVTYATMAIAAIHEIKDLFPVNELQIRAGLLGFEWAGRLEIHNQLVLDGAHNVSGIKAFISNVQQLFPDKQFIIIFGSMKSKDYQAMINSLFQLERLKQVILVPLDSDRGCDYETLRIFLQDMQSSEQLCIPRYTSINESSSTSDKERAYILKNNVVLEETAEGAFTKYGTLNDNEVLCVLGSLHLIGEIKRLMGGNKND